MRTEAGFTVVEMLIAVALMMVVMGVVFSLANPAQGIFQTQSQVSEMQQHLRVGVDTLTRDLAMAGAGISRGSAAGPLISYFAPLMPFRRGDAGDDRASATFYRPDTISIVYVPSTPAQTMVATAASIGGDLALTAVVNCGPAAHDAVCGFTKDMRVLILEPQGAFNVATVADVQGTGIQVRHGSALEATYDRGDAVLAEVVSRTYYLKTEPSMNTFQLMQYDGSVTDRPVLDNVVKLEFEYFGDPQPPQLVSRSTEPARATYGPTPPAIDVDDVHDTWSAGENCVFVVASGTHVPRLATLSTSNAPVKLSRGILEDGPWCPDAAHGARFDADLLRIRTVRVVMRVQAGAGSMRGPAGALFTRGGTLTSAERFAPDQEIQVDVTPRNMGR